MRALSLDSAPRFLPLLAVAAGIATFSAMDAVIKGAALAAGVFAALLLRNVFGTVLMVPLWLAGGRPLPEPATLRVHVQRAAVVALMGVLFFHGLVRIPLAEGIALSFIAPILALWFAALMLGERIRPAAIAAAGLGIVGVLVIGAGRFGMQEWSADAAEGVAAVLCSAVLYAVNLVLQRKQALLAGPVEIALFQNGVAALFFLAFAPWFMIWPDAAALRLILAGAALATAALLLLAWGYARAEAQVLVPIEYTAFLWAALLGWAMFGERLDLATLAGAALILPGCWIAARAR